MRLRSRPDEARYPVGVTVTLAPSRGKPAFLVLGGLLFLGGAVLLADVSWVSFAVGCVGGCVGLLLGAPVLVGGARVASLRLDAEAATVHEFPRRVELRWSDVESFYTVTVGPSVANVCYRLRAGSPARTQAGARRALLLVTGGNSGFRYSYGGMDAYDLAAYLNVWRNWAVQNDALPRDAMASPASSALRSPD